MAHKLQAAIVAGGKGTRMRGIAPDLPKAMLQVEGKPLLEHQILWLRAAGFREVFLCLGYKAGAVESFFKDGRAWGMKLLYRVEKEERGTAGCVRDLSEETAGDLLVVYGDLFIDMNLRRFLDFHAARPGAATLAVWRSDHPLDSDLVRLEGERATGFYRAKPGEPYENWALAALWAVRPELLGIVSEDRPSDFGRDVFPEAARQGMILNAYKTDERLSDLGTPERLEAFLKTRYL